MKIKIKVLKQVMEKSLAKDNLSLAGLKGLQQFDDSIVDFSDNDEVDLAEVLAMIANDVDDPEWDGNTNSLYSSSSSSSCPECGSPIVYPVMSEDGGMGMPGPVSCSKCDWDTDKE